MAVATDVIMLLERGHHAYLQGHMDSRNRSSVAREAGNEHDDLAISVVKESSIVGHVPMEYSMSIDTNEDPVSDSD